MILLTLVVILNLFQIYEQTLGIFNRSRPFFCRHFVEQLVHHTNPRIFFKNMPMPVVKIPVEAVEQTGFFTMPFLVIVKAGAAVVTHLVDIVGR
jgi:hypothetical protein